MAAGAPEAPRRSRRSTDPPSTSSSTTSFSRRRVFGEWESVDNHNNHMNRAVRQTSSFTNYHKIKNQHNENFYEVFRPFQKFQYEGLVRSPWGGLRLGGCRRLLLRLHRLCNLHCHQRHQRRPGRKPQTCWISMMQSCEIGRFVLPPRSPHQSGERRQCRWDTTCGCVGSGWNRLLPPVASYVVCTTLTQFLGSISTVASHSATTAPTKAPPGAAHMPTNPTPAPCL